MPGIFFLVLLISSFTSPALCDSNTESVLLEIKKQLNNPSALSSWVKGTNYCYWKGVLCDGPDGNGIYMFFLNGYDPSFDDLSAPFPRAICNLTGLSSLQLNNVKLNGSVPSCINNLSNLFELYIVNTNLSGRLPGFPNHQRLFTITITGNQFSHSIPATLSTLPSLTTLDLSSNKLTGSIPPGLVRNNGDFVLRLSNNNLTGEIPSSYGSAICNEFSVDRNQLRGDASFLFGDQKYAINYLYLRSNNFKFDLSNVQMPPSLNRLDLSHNKIWGKIPDSLANCRMLEGLDLSYNKLCGPIPQGGQLWKFNADSYSNNKCLCGTPLPPCSNSKHSPPAAPAPAPMSF